MIRHAPPATLTRALPLDPNATPGQRWRFRRNVVIYTAHCGGASQRLLAEVFDLPRSRIHEIVEQFRAFDPDPPPAIPPPKTVQD